MSSPRQGLKQSLGSVLSNLKPLRDHLGDRRAVGINFRAIEAYITARRGNGKSNATINRELELLRRALRLAHDRQLSPSIPKVRVLTEHNTRQGFFERPTWKPWSMPCQPTCRTSPGSPTSRARGRARSHP